MGEGSLLINIPVLCTCGSVFQLYFYKYFAALLLLVHPKKFKAHSYLNYKNEGGGYWKVQST